MKTLLDFLSNPITLVLSMYIGLWVWESNFPARNLPRVKYWRLRGVSFFILNFVLASVLPLLVDRHLVRFQLVDIGHMNVWLASFLGVFIYQGILYAWHRAMHQSDTLWRVFHQMHHSSERLDIPSAFYTSPMDTIGFTLIGSISFVLLIGLSPQAATVAMLFLTFLSLFQHANIRTPRWIGYVIQRPESHSVHHGRGIHRYNYSDFPVFDMIFGTFRNPKNFRKATGFYEGASSKLTEMLTFRDVSKKAN